ncbi:DUF6894 family protein [Phenylobacterium deserti]|uniref:DUF6894 domain-containing protein n=1 Tax=Phenylobacterium deserti TaxID=1914756 RepID=A0A328AWG3_9CAUL|nr:hypothetical protein [Phenylobacterium deserti]RAK58056.1 hypothetical protein DJ018_09150 [Phenylobacterium deserti]
MARYYFHLHDYVDVPDPEGQDLPDLAAAIAHAVQQARGLAGELIKETGRVVLSHRIDIEDADGAVLHTLRLADALSIEQ